MPSEPREAAGSLAQSLAVVELPMRIAPVITASCLLLGAAGPAGAQHPDIDREVERLVPQITEIRHHIHEHPELGNREVETAALVADHLRELGFDDVRTGIAHTGVVGILRGGRPGPVIAVRADMDALPVTEETDLPFRSTRRTTYLGQEVGVMHACGHDVHTAVQLGVASILKALQDDLPGTVMFIFQPAEEGPPPGEKGGAALMLEEGVFDELRPEAIFGLHASAHLDVGKAVYTPGGALAAVDHFRVTIRGRQSHGAAPHLGVDPVVMAAQAVSTLQTIRSRNLPPLAPSVVTVGMIRGGTRFNIIPGEVRLEGTVRTYDPEVQNTVERRMREILDGVTRAGGGSFELDYDRITPVTINDLTLTERSVPSLRDALGADNVAVADPWMAGEDFSLFANEVPGFFYLLGTLAPGTTSGDHHSPTFRADDSALPMGMRSMAYLLWDYLHERSGP
ncbi:MAG: amidohydrolase [Acidobacteria bacterium]|nr:amidohydrolase [Acidobacteriota bacterium]MYJ05280.1 amidohydrolase [Acidobacteriota bacterium]